jgi:hypothetical protein
MKFLVGQRVNQNCWLRDFLASTQPVQIMAPALTARASFHQFDRPTESLAGTIRTKSIRTENLKLHVLALLRLQAEHMIDALVSVMARA